MNTVHLTVSGRVQGVYFRAYTQKQAIKLGVFGFVKNSQNGTVEIVASAEQEQLNDFINWCHKGPLLANVSQVLVKDYATTKFTQFEIH